MTTPNRTDVPDQSTRGITRSTFFVRVGGVAGLATLGSMTALLNDTLAVHAQSTTAGGVRSSGSGTFLGSVKSMARNSARAYTDPASGDPAVLIRLVDGGYASYDAVCTHAGCTVPYDPARKLLVCPCHGAVYDPARGAKVLSGPAPRPLKTLRIRVDATGNVYALDGSASRSGAPSTLRPAPKPGQGGDDSGGDESGRAARRRVKRHGDN